MLQIAYSQQYGRKASLFQVQAKWKDKKKKERAVFVYTDNIKDRRI